MKLLLCASCGDLVKMTRELRACACGQALGRYLDDDATVEQTAGSMSIALHNHDLHAALSAYRDAPDAWHPLFVVRAYLNPLSEPDVVYLPASEPHGA